jgi:steroid delta-isomerase-like uncharacterized protein
MNMAWADRWLEQNFNQRNLEGLRALYHPQVKFADVPLGLNVDGWSGVAEFLGGFFVPAAGTHRFIPTAYLGNEREGVVEWTWEGTMNELDLFSVGQPTPGKSFSVRGNSVFRFDGQGLIVEERDYWDLLTVQNQLRG